MKGNKFFKVLKDAAQTLKGEESKKKYITAFCAFLIFSLLLELFVFNFRAVESLFFGRIENTVYTVENASEISDGKYRANSETVEIRINDINAVLKNVYVGLERDSAAYTKVGLWAKDEANFNGISAPEREIVDGLKQTKYIKTNFGGKTEDLRISLSELTAGEEFILNDVKLNVHVPVCFSVLRLLFVLGVIMLLYVIRPKSFIYKYKFDLNVKWQKIAVMLFAVVQIVFILGLCNISTIFHNPPYLHHAQYQELADAFLDGHTYLSEEPPQQLMDIENPFDPSLRNFYFAWDHAYHDGKYYVYFGAVPVIVFYLPYRLITGLDFPNYLTVFINCALMCIAVLMLLYEIIKKWFKNTPFGIYMLTSIIMCDTCGIIYMAKRPDFYSIPIAMAIMLAIFGLTFWLKAEIIDETGKKHIKGGWLAGGSICMALTSGCRPQILLATFFGVILFWNAVFKERTLFSKKSVKNTIAICLPYVIIGAAVMLYNYVRFDSPFDFGANYNLTSNDMTHRGIHMDRNLTGLFYYLFQLPQITNIFPYVQMINVTSLYQGLTLSEQMMGGLLWLSPITLLGIRGLWKRNWYEKESDKRPYIIMAAAVVLGVFIILTDSQVSGILSRYYSDFSWLFLLAAAIAVFSEYASIKRNNCSENTFIKILVTCFIISIIFYGFNIFNDVGPSVIESNPEFYYKAKYLIGFLV